MNAIETKNHGYLLLLKGDEWWKQLGREELEKYVAASNAWLGELVASGKAVAAQGLGRSGTIVSGRNGRNITDAPFAEAKEVVGGYLLLNVETFREAVAIAKTAPNLAHGASIEVRPLTNECPSEARLEELRHEEKFAIA